MKILWLSQNVPYPPKTGVLQRNYNLLREASRIGEVTLLAVVKENILPEEFDLDEALEQLGKFCERIEIVNLPIESSRLLLLATAFKSLFTRDPFSINWIRCREMSNKIATLVREIEFDIIHFDTISLAAYHELAGPTPKVLNHHNIESHLLLRRTLVEENPVKKQYYQLEGRKLQRYEHDVCPKFDRNFTVSSLDGERLEEIAPGISTDVIANGVDVDYFYATNDVQPTAGRLIMVSGMNWFPNRDAVLHMCQDIWPALAKEIPAASWICVGSSPPPELLSLADQDDRVVVTGFVDDVRPYMADAQIYLCPMRDGGGTRLKILDAMSMGKPIVATSMAYEGIAVTPEENVLIADSPAEFVVQIRRLMNDAQLCRTLGENARSFVTENYSWPVIGKRLADNYRSIIDGSTG